MTKCQSKKKHYKMGFWRRKNENHLLKDIFQCHLTHFPRESFTKSKGEVELKVGKQTAFFRGRDCVLTLRAAHRKEAQCTKSMPRIGPRLTAFFFKGMAHPQSAVHWVCARRIEPKGRKIILLHQNSFQIDSFASK